jgi:quercetin 2,3-dioxygenase
MLGKGIKIRRALPHRDRRMVGAWCFFDHFGPLTISSSEGMRVGPHPHIGLQTVSWLIEGEVLHRDSLGYQQLIRRDQLNIMTAGRGIVHSEETPTEHSDRLHGLQLWIALPNSDRHTEPAFEHHPALPRIARDGMHITLLVGEGLDEKSPARMFTPIVGYDVTLTDTGTRSFELDPSYEHAVLLTDGIITIGSETMKPSMLYYLGMERDVLTISNESPARFAIIGGEPFGEKIILWWNLVARTTEEISQARDDWEAYRYFGEVKGYDGPRLVAPALTTSLKAR